MNDQSAAADATLERTGAGPKKQKVTLLFAGLLVAMLLASLDQTVFSTALPTIVGELNGVNHMLWVTTAYILASTVVLPVYGKLGDLIGRRSLFIIAISIFVGGSVIGGPAPDMTWLIIGRTVQGLGGGGLMVLAQAIIADVVPARDRGKYNGIMGGVFALSSVAGPLLGGWFTEGIGWRWAFWINVPLGLVAIASAVFFLRLPKRTSGRPKVDLAGIGLLALASSCIVLVTTWGGNTYAWDSPEILALITGAVIGAVGFVLVERRAAEPLMPGHLFKDRNFNLTTAAGLISGLAMFGAIAYIPTYLQMVTGYDATRAGLLMIPMMAGLLVASIVIGQVVSRTGRYKWYPVIGMVVVAGALALLSTMTPATSVVAICCYLALMGVGLGMSMQLLVLIVQNSFPVSQVGTATSSNNYFRQMGSSIGSAAVGSIFVARLADLFGQRLPAGSGLSTNSLTPEAVRQLPEALGQVVVGAYNDALTPVFLYLMPVVLVGAVILLFVTEKPLATTIEPDALPETLGVAGETWTDVEPSGAAGARQPVGVSRYSSPAAGVAPVG